MKPTIPAVPSAAPCSEKKAYVAPRLVAVGKVSELTRAGSPNPDAMDNANSVAVP
jgi:hypothetical protein